MLLFVHRDHKDYQGREAQDGHLHFHTANDVVLNVLECWADILERIYKAHEVRTDITVMADGATTTTTKGSFLLQSLVYDGKESNTYKIWKLNNTTGT